MSTNSSAKSIWSPLRIVCGLIVLGLFAAFGVSSCHSNDAPTPTVTVVPSAGNPGAPATNPAALSILPPPVLQAELRAASGAPIKLSDYSGKVVLINLWATWCGPCQIETPELVKLHKEYEERGVQMVGLSTEDPDFSAESVRNFIRAYKIDYPIGWVTPEVAAVLMQGRGSIPQSFVISRDGRIVRRFVGFSPERTPPQLRQALEDALKLAS